MASWLTDADIKAQDAREAAYEDRMYLDILANERAKSEAAEQARLEAIPYQNAVMQGAAGMDNIPPVQQQQVQQPPVFGVVGRAPDNSRFVRSDMSGAFSSGPASRMYQRPDNPLVPPQFKMRGTSYGSMLGAERTYGRDRQAYMDELQQANIDRNFEENQRRFGTEIALRQRTQDIADAEEKRRARSSAMGEGLTRMQMESLQSKMATEKADLAQKQQIRDRANALNEIDLQLSSGNNIDAVKAAQKLNPNVDSIGMNANGDIIMTVKGKDAPVVMQRDRVEEIKAQYSPEAAKALSDQRRAMASEKQQQAKEQAALEKEQRKTAEENWKESIRKRRDNMIRNVNVHIDALPGMKDMGWEIDEATKKKVESPVRAAIKSSFQGMAEDYSPYLSPDQISVLAYKQAIDGNPDLETKVDPAILTKAMGRASDVERKMSILENNMDFFESVRKSDHPMAKRFLQRLPNMTAKELEAFLKSEVK